MFKRLRCWLGFHAWGKWIVVPYSGQVGEQQEKVQICIRVRECQHCGDTDMRYPWIVLTREGV